MRDEFDKIGAEDIGLPPGQLLEAGLGAFAGAMMGGLMSAAAIVPMAAIGALAGVGLRPTVRLRTALTQRGPALFRSRREKIGE
jgi:hypothetical protein